MSLATSGLLLTRQSYEFMCTSNVVDDLIPSFVLELLAPNGTSLAHNLSSTLSYTLPSLDASDGGTYTCKGVLVIAGSGINSTATAVKYITILGKQHTHACYINFIIPKKLAHAGLGIGAFARK